METLLWYEPNLAPKFEKSLRAHSNRLGQLLHLVFEWIRARSHFDIDLGITKNLEAN